MFAAYYFVGRILWTAGMALLSDHWLGLLYPAAVIYRIFRYNIPEKSQYLRKKYEREYDVYESQTPALFPFVY